MELLKHLYPYMGSMIGGIATYKWYRKKYNSDNHNLTLEDFVFFIFLIVGIIAYASVCLRIFYGSWWFA